LALAIVSRSVADDDGDLLEPLNCNVVDIGSPESEEVWDDLFEGGENAGNASEDSVEKVGEPVLGALADFFITSPVTFGGGFANASWTDGLGFRGLAANVLLPLTAFDNCLGPASTLCFRAQLALLGTGGFNFEGVAWPAP